MMGNSRGFLYIKLAPPILDRGGTGLERNTSLMWGIGEEPR